MSLQLIYFSFFSGWGTLVEAATAFMFMNCCFCGSPQHNLISKGQGQLQGLDFYQGMKHLYRVCLYSMRVDIMQEGFLNYNKPYGRDMNSCLNGPFVAECWAALLC